MRDLYLDREIAEQIWLEEWEEIQAEEHLLRLWQEAQAKAEQVNDEALALIEQDVEEIPF